MEKYGLGKETRPPPDKQERQIKVGSTQRARPRAYRTSTADRVFPITDVAFRQAWDRLRIRAGIDCLTFHDLRHEAILYALFVPSLSAYEGIAAAFSPMSLFWNFARYDHPWWAFLITIVLILFYIKASNR